jgi:hypothetical protein
MAYLSETDFIVQLVCVQHDLLEMCIYLCMCQLEEFQVGIFQVRRVSVSRATIATITSANVAKNVSGDVIITFQQSPRRWLQVNISIPYISYTTAQPLDVNIDTKPTLTHIMSSQFARRLLRASARAKPRATFAAPAGKRSMSATSHTASKGSDTPWIVRLSTELCTFPYPCFLGPDLYIL